MDLDDFRTILSNSEVDVWSFIDAAITVASSDYRDEFKNRRDAIVERLYTALTPPCRNCEVDCSKPNGKTPIDGEVQVGHERRKRASPSTPQSNHRVDTDDDDDEEEIDPYDALFEDEETKVLRIKELLEDTEQAEDSLVELLQTLADMDITLKALKETDIGRHVNRLRKHSSSDVRRLVKQLVSKWKDLVDDWVKMNAQGGSTTLIADEDSPQQNVARNFQNGHHQVPDFGYSPNPHNGSSSSDRNNSEPEPKAKIIARTQIRPPQSVSASASAPPPNIPKKEERSMDLERLASARRRLQENYQEAAQAKKQRTIQVMDIHDLPKPKNTFFAKNKGGSQGRSYR